MKKLMYLLFGASLILTSCGEDDTTETPDQEIVLENNANLPGTVKSGNTLVLSAGYNFNLKNALRVEDGGVLKIEKGVTVTASGANATSLFVVVEQGGKIEAEGTKDEPIVFTASNKEPASWGGLLICGRAPINVGESAIAEIGDASYGGTKANDNSGTIKYVRVEYTGSQINSEKQHNGFTFYGVGNGTTVEYISAYKGADDGVEFFGGTVNVSYVAIVGSQDDQFDFAEGWTGTATNLYLSQIDDATYPQDKGIEGDNLGSNNSATPYSNPTIKNVTIIGFQNNMNGDGESTDGIRIREGAKGNFDNIVIKNYGDDGIDARSIVTLQNLVSGELKFSNVYTSGLGDKPFDAKIDDGETDGSGTADAAKVALAASIVTTEPLGSGFSAWGEGQAWVKLN